MGRIKRCDSRCHQVRGTRCGCWCGGHFHGTAGSINREALRNAVTEAEKVHLLEENGFQTGQAVYLEQPRLPLEKTAIEINSGSREGGSDVANSRGQ